MAWIGAAIAALGLIADQMSGSAGRRAQAGAELRGKQQSLQPNGPYQPSSEQANSVLPDTPPGTSLNQALGYDEARRTGQPGATDTSFSEEPNMSFEARDYSGGAELGGSMPPPQAGAYSGTQPSTASEGGGLSTDQYVQLGKLGLQAAQAFGGSAQPSPMPRPGSPQPYQTVASRTRRL